MATASYKIISQNLERSLQTTAAESDMKRQTDGYLTHIRDVRLPEASGVLDIDEQAAPISEKLNIDDLKDPAKPDKMIVRFTSLWEAQNQPATPTNALLDSSMASFGISGDLLASIQNSRLGGS